MALWDPVNMWHFQMIFSWAMEDIIIITSGWSMNCMASVRVSTLSCDIGIGAGPSPLWWILSPQKNWSPKNGTMVVGHWNSKFGRQKRPKRPKSGIICRLHGAMNAYNQNHLTGIFPVINIKIFQNLKGRSISNKLKILNECHSHNQEYQNLQHSMRRILLQPWVL